MAVCKLCEILDLSDLGVALLAQTLERVLEEVQVRSKERFSRNIVVVLPEECDEQACRSVVRPPIRVAK
jgi:hypothetical protein